MTFPIIPFLLMSCVILIDYPNIPNRNVNEAKLLGRLFLNFPTHFTLIFVSCL